MNDRGSVLPLIAGLLALAGVFAVAVIDSTDLSLTRSELQSVADAAALAAAQDVNPTTATISDGHLSFAITRSAARRDVRSYLDASAATGTVIRSVTVPDGRTVVVTLSRQWRAPLDSDFIPIRMRVTATARARTLFD
ncbi:MAG: hypothetical protein RLZ72_482 [Actinomycetota bacterium]